MITVLSCNYIFVINIIFLALIKKNLIASISRNKSWPKCMTTFSQRRGLFWALDNMNIIVLNKFEYLQMLFICVYNKQLRRKLSQVCSLKAKNKTRALLIESSLSFPYHCTWLSIFHQKMFPARFILKLRKEYYFSVSIQIIPFSIYS